MSAKVPHDSPPVRKLPERVAAPATQARAKRLSPTYALAWLHLVPESFFPVRSRSDMAAKMSAGLLGGASPVVQRAGSTLPAAARQAAGKNSDES